MDEPSGGEGRRLRSFALGASVGAAGTIATVRRLRRASGARTGAGLAAFEDAPCFLELSRRPARASAPSRSESLGTVPRPMPIYEYKCPNGHLLRGVPRHDRAGPAASARCAAPRRCSACCIPVAVHYKGSGFYSTDYGRGGGKGARRRLGRRRLVGVGPRRRRLVVGSERRSTQSAARRRSSARLRLVSSSSSSAFVERLESYCSGWPGAAAGPEGRRRRLRRRVARPHRERAAVVLARDDHRRAADAVGRRRAGSGATCDPDERNFTQPSSSSCQVERSVVSGFISELPSNGSLERACRPTSSFAVGRLRSPPAAARRA